MTVTLIGGGPATPVDRAEFRYRITWIFVGAAILPDFTLNSHTTATALRDALPALGLIPVSPIAAVQGDPFIQFTCQVGSQEPGAQIRTLADIIEAANKLPLLQDIALNVSEIEIRAAGLPMTIVNAQDKVSRQRAIDAAEQRDLANKAADVGAAIGEATKGALGATGSKVDEYLTGLFGGLKDIAFFALGVAGLVGIGYVIVRFRK